jgi:hypothetical protein
MIDLPISFIPAPFSFRSGLVVQFISLPYLTPRVLAQTNAEELMMRSLISAAAFLVAIPMLTAADAHPNDLSGIYSCEGEGPTGPYRGVAFVRKTGDNYRFEWATEGGGRTLGVGMLKDGKISVGWVQFKGTEVGNHGVTVFEVNGKQLKGRWSGFGSDDQHSETLDWMKNMPPAKTADD